jgi:cell division protein FtsI/penicillin-binding protein 2
MNDYTRTIETRLKLFGVFIIIVVAGLFWRMYILQVLQHEKYLTLAKNQQRYEITEMGQRGRIYVHDSPIDSRAYYPLAFDQKKFAVWVVPKQVKNKAESAKILSQLLSMPESEVFEKINNDKLYIPPIKHGLSLDESKVVKDKKLSGVLIVPEYSRYYPEGTLASQVLGYVNAEGNGNYGFEGKYNAEMKGKEGRVKGEKDTLGRVISLLEQEEPEDGASYVLTIDRSVQYFVEKKLKEALELYKATSGSVVIMDVKTGGIVAMASLPTYDPNNFRVQANLDPSLFMNPVISSPFEPGSIFKPMIMSAAIDQGLVAPETKGNFAASVVVDGYTINTAERKAFGEEDMTQVLQNSDNVAMVWLSEKLGKDNMYKYVQSYNILERTGVDLDGETTGWTDALKLWRDSKRATVSFGQGITATPLQMVAAYAAIANNGVYVKPHVVDKIVFPDGTEKQIEKVEEQRVISEDTAKKMQEMLYQVVEKGHSWRAKVPGYKIGAKTGTAQISTNGVYEESEDGLGIYIHTLAGFAPTNDPQFAMIVKLDRPKSARYAESTAAPMFGEISSFLLNYHYRIAPTEVIPK